MKRGVGMIYILVMNEGDQWDPGMQAIAKEMAYMQKRYRTILNCIALV